MTPPQETLVAGARVMLPGADPHAPPHADILIRGDRIAAICAPGELPIPPGAAEHLRRHLTGLLQDEVDRAFAEQESL